MSSVRWNPRFPLLVEGLTALGLIAAPFVLPHLDFAPGTVNQVLVWGLFGIGFDILFGYTGLLSFGQSAFFGTGGFVAAYLLTHDLMSGVVAALIVGTIGAMFAGVVVGVIALRRTGIYFAMITVAIAETFYFIEFSPLSDYTGGENGLPGVPTPSFSLGHFSWRASDGWSMYVFLAACYFVGIVVALRIVRSPVGSILSAIRDNPLRARAVGHNVWRYKLAAFVIAAAYAGFAGGLLGVLQGFMPPEAFTFDTSGQLVIQTAIGGVGTLFGPLLGAAVWLYLRDFLQQTLHLGSAWQLVLGIVFVLLVLFLRRGLIGAIQDVKLRLFRPRDAAPEEAAKQAAAPVVSVGRVRPHDASFSGPVLEARRLTKSFGGVYANRNIDLSVQRGELRAIIGPNGAGKTTFFRMLTCETAPSSGKIIFEGQDITGMSIDAVCQRGLTKTYQVNQLFSRMTVRENVVIAALAERRGRFKLDLLRRPSRVPGLAAQVESTLSLVGLAGRADVPVAELAYGEKRRLEIGLALATSPSLLLLDEPLAGMSPQERVETVQLLKNIRRGRTLIVVEHDMDAVFELAERITVLHEGTLLADGTPAEIQGSGAVQEAYLGGVAT